MWRKRERAEGGDVREKLFCGAVSEAGPLPQMTGSREVGGGPQTLS